MTKVTFTKDVSKFGKLLKEKIKYNFSLGDKVCVKLHMGEGKGHFDIELTKIAVKVLKDLGCEVFLFDTTGLYKGSRFTPEGYLKVAAEHGFSEENIGCPIIVDDDFEIVKTDHMDFHVAKKVKAHKLLVLTHVKGHGFSGFGASIKNLAMGCGDKVSKRQMHTDGQPVLTGECTGCEICHNLCFDKAAKIINSKVEFDYDHCWGCNVCIKNCPEQALKPRIASFDRLLAEGAQAVIKYVGRGNVFYVNDFRKITKCCDCFPDPGEAFVEDVGIFLSENIVAIDRACFDMINKRDGDVFLKELKNSPIGHIKEASSLDLGKMDYELETI